MSDADKINAAIMGAILLLAIVRPGWIWPYVLRVSLFLLALFVGLWVLGSLMEVQP